MDYALIENGTVVNIIYLHPMNANDFSNAVATNGLPVQIGDTYTDGKYYRDGEEVTEKSANNEQELIDSIIAEVQND